MKQAKNTLAQSARKYLKKDAKRNSQLPLVSEEAENDPDVSIDEE